MTALLLLSQIGILSPRIFKVVATDTVKNICYVVAKQDDMNSPEEYGLSLARKFLDEYSFVTGVRIEALEKPWSRAIVNGAVSRSTYAETALEKLRHAHKNCFDRS